MHKSDRKADRKLGDEWLDWDGQSPLESTEADYRLFLWLAAATCVTLIAAGFVFLWLIYPRLSELGGGVPNLVAILFGIVALALLVWTVLFAWSAVIRRPVVSWILMPGLINRLLSAASTVGKPLGISTDKLTNSFFKINNTLVGSHPKIVAPERLLLLAPRCLTKESNQRLRTLRDKYGIVLAVVGGGTDARLKIRQNRPEMVLAVACERDLLSGFKEVNVRLPVIGFPNTRPEGPCKNTCVDLGSIEAHICRCLGIDRATVSNSVDN